MLPQKAYEILALSVFTPWVLATFGQPPGRRRLHWLPGGLIGGLSITLDWAFIAYGALGIAALAMFTWRESSQRARYVRHVALTGRGRRGRRLLVPGPLRRLGAAARLQAGR